MNEGAENAQTQEERNIIPFLTIVWKCFMYSSTTVLKPQQTPLFLSENLLNLIFI